MPMNQHTVPSDCIVLTYISSFSTFFLNLVTCSTSCGLTSLGQPPSVWLIPREPVSNLSVLICRKILPFETYIECILVSAFTMFAMKFVVETCLSKTILTGRKY